MIALVQRSAQPQAARRLGSTARASSRRSCSRGRAADAVGRGDTAKATTDLAFEVTVENLGDGQEVGIEVTLTIQKSPAADRQDADDRRHQLGERRRSPFQDPRAAVRTADDAEGGRRTGARRGAHGQQQAEYHHRKLCLARLVDDTNRLRRL